MSHSAAPEKLSSKHRDRFPFTEQRLAKLNRPQSGARNVYDTDEPGLGVRLTPTNAVFIFYRWHQGSPGRITIAKVGAVALREVRRIAAGLRGDLARGIDIFAKARLNKKPPELTTLRSAYDVHIARPDLRRTTLSDYASLWKRVPERLKARPIMEIDSATIEKLHHEVGVKHQRTANRLLALLSVLFTRNGRRQDNPVVGVVRFRQSPRQRVLTIDELRRFRVALDSEPEPWRSYFLLAMLTGARRSALARMRWEDLDLDAATWRIPAEWSKNRKVLTVALPTEAVDVLRTLCAVRGASPWVFPANSVSGHLVEPQKAWRRVMKRAGIEGAVLHDLRRTLGTAVAADGAGAAIISAVLGHLSMESAKSYIHLSAEMARDAVERAARRTTGAA
jgi:integrase